MALFDRDSSSGWVKKTDSFVGFGLSTVGVASNGVNVNVDVGSGSVVGEASAACVGASAGGAGVVGVAVDACVAMGS